jgi:formylglycine-generating enzyme required for sulfatase activity
LNAPEDPVRIEPVAYRPGASGGGPRPGRPRVSPLNVALAAAILITLVCGWFLLTARAVRIEISPAPDSMSLQGGFDLSIGGEVLVRPGEYQLLAKKQGYRPLATRLTIAAADNPPFRFELAKLPGLLSVNAKPQAEIRVDGKPAGRTPQPALELEPGKHRISLLATKHEVYEQDIEIEGAGVQQTLNAELVPAWAAVSLSSDPAQAELSVDGAVVGKTPLTTDIGVGLHSLSLKLEGYKAWTGEVTVIANQAQKLPTVKLSRADGQLKIVTQPAGASVSVDGSFRGQTPLTVDLAPGKPRTIKLSKAGYKTAEQSVELAADEARALDVQLEAILGVIELSVSPTDAEVRINGQLQPQNARRLSLPAAPQELSVSRAGYAPYTSTVTPRPGFDQRVDVVLKSESQARAERVPPRITSAGGQTLKLIQPGSFTMGSERGTQGRQANEGLRPVRLTRAFYLATTETTNAQFRQFDAAYSSGIVGRKTLDNETQPVVRVTWQQAARYCNWLSAKEGLPPAYADAGGTLTLSEPRGIGYRLPTEAEWEWAARFAGQDSGLRYPWGAAMPPPANAGNYADKSAATLLTEHLTEYDDGFPATAAVASFPPNALGLFDMGGNVAEWVNDLYGASLVIGAQEAVDPAGGSEGTEHLIRGSSWMHGRITELRLAYRGYGSEGRQDVGFRIARYAEPPP